MAGNTPIMLLDVDGPLNPYAAKANKRPEGYTVHRMTPTGWEDNPLHVWLNHSMGAQLKSLGYEIIWATTWAEDANEWISPNVGLPTDLECIEWGPHGAEIEQPGLRKLYWKTPQIAAWMHEHYPDRPFIWVDDEAFKKDEKYLKSKLGQPLKVFTINPAKGIDDDDLKDFKDWKDDLGG
jgi:hypothetical protein